MKSEYIDNMLFVFLKKISDPTTHFYPFKEKKYQAQTNRCRTLDVVSNLCKIE
jgi:hypothetical protein